MPKPTLQLQAGQLLRLKKALVKVDGGVADLAGPPGRQMIVMTLGVSDGGPFDAVAMLDVLGFVPKAVP